MIWFLCSISTPLTIPCIRPPVQYFFMSGYFLIGFILLKMSSFPLHPHESITSLRYHELEKTTLFQEVFPKILFSQFCFRSYKNKMKYCHQALVFLQLLCQDILHCGWHSVTGCLFLKLFHVSFHVLDQKVFGEILFCSFPQSHSCNRFSTNAFLCLVL